MERWHGPEKCAHNFQKLQVLAEGVSSLTAFISVRSLVCTYRWKFMFTCLYLVVLLLCFWFVSQSQQQFCEHIWVLKFSSAAQSCPTPWTAARQASLSITNSQSLLKLMSIGSVMPSNPLILCGPLLLPRSIFPSIRVFSNESTLRIRWPKHWSFSFSISPSNEYFQDWFPLGLSA